jgi:hypothetical protein
MQQEDCESSLEILQNGLPADNSRLLQLRGSIRGKIAENR